jgi:ABC-2 type transport system permease protein
MSRDALFRIGVLVRHNTMLRLRDPGHVLSYVVMPIVLVLALRPLYQAALPAGDTQAVVGMLVMFSVLSMSIVGTALVTERIWHTWDQLRGTRATTAELLLGKAVPVFAVLLLQQAALLAFGRAAFGLRVASVPLLALAVAVWGTTLLAVGSAVGVLARSTGELAAICDVGALAVSALGGALAPVSLLPGWVQAVAPASPGYWAVGLLRAAAAGDAAGTGRSAAVLLALAVAAGALAAVRLNRGLSQIRG